MSSHGFGLVLHGEFFRHDFSGLRTIESWRYGLNAKSHLNRARQHLVLDFFHGCEGQQ